MRSRGELQLIFVALPVMRKPEPESEFLACRVTLIKWVANYMHVAQKKPEGAAANNAHPSTPQPPQNHEENNEHEIAHASLDSSEFINSGARKRNKCSYVF